MLGFRADPGTRRILEALARREGCSLSRVVNDLLERAARARIAELERRPRRVTRSGKGAQRVQAK